MDEGGRALATPTGCSRTSPWPGGATSACRCWSSRPPAVTPRRSSGTSCVGHLAPLDRGRPDQGLLLRQRRREGDDRRRRRRRRTAAGCSTSSSRPSPTRWCRRSTPTPAARRRSSSPARRSARSTRWRWSAATPTCSASAICMSGTFDIERFIGGFTDDLYFSSPLHFLPGLEGRRSTRCGSGSWCSPRAPASGRTSASRGGRPSVLGDKGVPNRVDDWGPDYDHDWPTWWQMLPEYLEQLT